MRLLLADEGVLFLEVPGSSPVIDGLRGFELWDEHLTYFSASNLARMVVAAGYTIVDAGSLPHRDSENLYIWCSSKKGGGDAALVHAGNERVIAGCRNFSVRWEEYCKELRQQAEKWPRPIFAAGASHLQSNFLLFTGLGKLVQGLADDDPVKLGRWVAVPQPVQVITTSALRDTARSGTMLLTGFGYPQWMKKIRAEVERVGVTPLDPLTGLDRFRSGVSQHRSALRTVK
jgi:hypothetical protein